MGSASPRIEYEYDDEDEHAWQVVYALPYAAIVARYRQP
jgi:hypothetical protein